MNAILPAAMRSELVSFANLAPSVHNTQPARWHFAADGAVWMLADPGRYLAAGDPTKRDAGLSCGAALEATVLGLARFGLTAGDVEILWGSSAASPVSGRDAAARLTLRPADSQPMLVVEAPRRFTWRRPFQPAESSRTRDLAAWAATRDDLALATGATALRRMSALNDCASLGFLRNRAFRSELLAWMRLSPADSRWSLDGLNAEALGMNQTEALGAGFVLRPPIFEAMDKLGLGRAIVSEEAKTLTASAIGLFHRPAEESPVVTGRAYLTMLLGLTRLGFQTWPMTAIADDPETAAETRRLHAVPDCHRLVSVLRIGVVPADASPERARIPPEQLITSEQL